MIARTIEEPCAKRVYEWSDLQEISVITRMYSGFL